MSIEFPESDIAWHYTIGSKVALIQKSGLLKRTSIGVSYPERPILWFSTHPEFEPSANKAVKEAGITRRTTVEEMRIYGNGVFRFGITKSALISWPTLAISAGMSRTMARKLEEKAVSWGANPLQWLGSLEDIPLARFSIEKMNDNMIWEKW